MSLTNIRDITGTVATGTNIRVNLEFNRTRTGATGSTGATGANGADALSEALPYNFGTDLSPDSNGEAFQTSVSMLFFNRDSNGRDNRQAFSSLADSDVFTIDGVSFTVDSIDASDEDHIQVDVTTAPTTPLSGAVDVRLPVALTGAAGANGDAGLPEYLQTCDTKIEELPLRQYPEQESTMVCLQVVTQ